MRIFNRTTPYFALASTILMVVVAATFATRIPFPNETARGAVGEQTISKDVDLFIYSRVMGAGPCIVMVASLGREASDFNELVKATSEAGYKSVTIEAGGINGSDISAANHMLPTTNAIRWQSVVVVSETTSFLLGTPLETALHAWQLTKTLKTSKPSSSSPQVGRSLWNPKPSNLCAIFSIR